MQVHRTIGGVETVVGKQQLALCFAKQTLGIPRIQPSAFFLMTTEEGAS